MPQATLPLSAPSDRDRRAELADAIVDAAAAVRAAKSAHDKADRMLHDARVAVDRLKAGLDAECIPCCPRFPSSGACLSLEDKLPSFLP